MADPLSIAASVAGLVSLGLQVSSGITQYLDAIKCRAEELDAARRYVQSIKSTLKVINGFPSRLQVQHQQSLAAISACLKPCEDELKALETLIAKLSNCGNANPDLIDRVGERTKKLAYSFNRTKLSQLEERLSRAVEVLQLAVQSLGIDVFATATDVFRTIETTTTRSATELLTVKSGITAIDNGVSAISRELPVVRSVVQSIVPELGLRTDSLSIQLHQGNQAVRDDIARTGDSITTIFQNELAGIKQSVRTQEQQLAELVRIARSQAIFPDLFGTQDHHSMTPTTLLGRVISKPGTLKDLCDGSEGRQEVVALRTADQRRYKLRRKPDGIDASGILPFRPTRSATCTCRPQRKMQRKQISYGSIHIYSDTTEYQRHLPICAYFQPTKMNKRTWGLMKSGAAWLLKQAVQISFSMTSSAGGLSLSPMFTYSATVDERIAPAFQVVESMINFFSHEDCETSHNGSEAARRILEAGFIKVGRLLREGLASPNDVNSKNQTLMEPISDLTWLIAMKPLNDFQNIASGFLERFLDYDIPVAQFDIYGRTPLGTLTKYFPLWSPAALEIALSRENDVPLVRLEKHHMFEQNIYRLDHLINLVHIQEDSPLTAEAFGCGSLSQAVLANDTKEVKSLLEKCPHMVEEKNLYGQTPLHFAASCSPCLELLLGASNGDTLNKADIWGYTTINYAISFSSRYCPATRGKRCRKCNCAQSTVMLLNADCAIQLRSNNLSRELQGCSRRCKWRFIKGLKNRRERLEKLAIENLSDLDKRAMALGSGCVLDIHAVRVIELLMEKGIKIPVALTLGETSNIQAMREPWGSVYHSIFDADDAELFFNCGFHDLDKLSDEGVPPLAMKNSAGLGHMILYFKWLVDHGADPFRLLYPTSARHGTMLAPATSAHGLYDTIGTNFSWSLYWESGWERPQSLPSLNSISYSQNPVDECQCNCSQQGCTPSLLMLMGSLRETMEEYISLRRLIEYYFTEYLRSFWSDLGPVHIKEAVRYLTFHALEIKHTCSHRPDIEWYVFWKAERKNEEEIEHIQNEQAEVICLLEQLIYEFEGKIDKILENDSTEPDGIIAFWTGCWLDRMQDEIEKLAGNNVPDDQRRGAEELGVVWHDSVYASDSEPDEEPKTVEDLLRKLDEIVPD